MIDLGYKIKSKSWLISSSIILAVLCVCALVYAALVIDKDMPQSPSIALSDTVSYQKTALNNNKWRTSFNISLKNQELVVLLRIRLVPGPRVSQPQIERLQAGWEPEVEAIWSDKFALIINDLAHPIELDLVFTHVNPHHTVVVRDQSDVRVDQLNWSKWSSSLIIAHEIGHMLGGYDEYAGGGQNPQHPLIKQSSLMSGAPDAHSQLAAHHFESIENWAKSRFDNAVVVPLN